MNFNQVLALVMLVCFLAGAADYVLGGRFGFSCEFENGLMTCGRLLLCMGGFMVLAPVIARVLGPVAAPFSVPSGRPLPSSPGCCWPMTPGTLFWPPNRLDKAKFRPPLHSYGVV